MTLLSDGCSIRGRYTFEHVTVVGYKGCYLVQGTVWIFSSERPFLPVTSQKDGDQAGSGIGVSEAESWQMTWKRTPRGFEKCLGGARESHDL